MPRFFNTAGPCDPALHYMLPPERRLPDVQGLIDRSLYFVLHAPRQSGKTTCFQALARKLTAEGRYVAVQASCERGQTARNDVDRGVRAVLRAIEMETRDLPPEIRPEPVESFEGIEAESRLTAYLSAWSERSRRPVVLFLDEIDALLDDSLLSVLRQLRSGYPRRPGRFPKSVALVGLRDVRDPAFNVKAESLTLRNFTTTEIQELYGQYTADTGQIFTPETVALAYELTRGQPSLVNALACQVVEVVVPNPALMVEARHVEQAREILIQRRDFHLDSLAGLLREPRVRRVLEPILAGELLPPDVFDDDVQFVQDLGLVTIGPSGLEIANPIYQEIRRLGEAPAGRPDKHAPG